MSTSIFQCGLQTDEIISTIGKGKHNIGFLGGLPVKNMLASARDMGSIPGLRISPGEGNGNTLQDSYLENPMDRGAWQGTVHGFQRAGHDLTTEPKH